jgi:hypothetical protein
MLSEAIHLTALRLLTFDPALFDQVWNDPRTVWQLKRFDPAGAAQVLHELPLTGIWKFHFFAFSPPFSTRRRMASARLISASCIRNPRVEFAAELIFRQPGIARAKYETPPPIA